MGSPYHAPRDDCYTNIDWLEYRIPVDVVQSKRKTVVLVVEDDAELRAMYREALSAIGGYAVVAVEDGWDALAVIEGESPAAVVLDLGLPRVRGQDVYAELRTNVATRSIPIIVVTGDARGIDPAEVDCILTKPVDIDRLVQSVRDCLGRAAPSSFLR